MIRDRLGDSVVIHFIKEWCLPGQAAQMLFNEARNDRSSMFVRYDDSASLTVARAGTRKSMSLRDGGDHLQRWIVDMVVLCPAVVPSADAAVSAERLGIPSDEHGFLKTTLPSIDSTESPVRGIFVAGACHAPMDIRSSANEGRAAAGHLLAELKPGGRIEISPIAAVVETVHCSGCMLCVTLCPFRAITIDPSTGRASVVAELCDGCGICIAACPSGAIAGRHFSGEAIVAEITGVLDDSQE
jgi:heterodisulfide reductase subunit A